MSSVKGFLGKVLETTAVHLIASSTARVTEQALTRSGEYIEWLRGKVKPFATEPTKATEPVGDSDSSEPGGKKTI
jgi:hypothetical protein